MVNLALQSRNPDLAGLPSIPENGWLSAEALIAAARRNCGLDDFGPSSFREGLERLLESLREDARLDGVTGAGTLALLLRRLQNRLGIEDWHKRNPDAHRAEIAGPLSITGLPRTGTTALANMMSLDPQFRPLRSWEQAQPCPPPTPAGDKDDPRRLAMLEQLGSLVEAEPGQMAMHLYDVDATEEDHDVLGLAFMAQHNTLPVSGFRDWWRAADLRPAYAYHQRVLQMLQSSRPPNFWLLKAPHHMFHMDALVNVYPDIRFIFTHRDPAKTVPSYISFVTSFYPAGTVERLGIKNIAQEIHRHLLAGMRTALETRARLGTERFVDVRHSQLNVDPLGILERLYDALSLPFTGSFADDVRQWQAQNQSGAHGAHRYAPEEFGLSSEQLRADYAFYTEQFGFEC